MLRWHQIFSSMLKLFLSTFTSDHACLFKNLFQIIFAKNLRKLLNILENFTKYLRTHLFTERIWWLLLKPIATLFSIETVSRTRVSCFPSLFLTKVTIFINGSSLNCSKLLSCYNLVSVVPHMLKPQLFSVKGPSPSFSF